MAGKVFAGKGNKMNAKECISFFQGKEITNEQEQTAKNRLKKIMKKGNSTQVAEEALKVLVGLP